MGAEKGSLIEPEEREEELGFQQRSGE